MQLVAFSVAHSFEPTKDLVAAVFAEAKRGNRVLSDDEIMAVVDRK